MGDLKQILYLLFQGRIYGSKAASALSKFLLRKYLLPIILSILQMPQDSFMPSLSLEPGGRNRK